MANGGSTPGNSVTSGRPAAHRSWRPAAQADGPRHQWQHQGRPAVAGRIVGRGTRRFRVALFFGLAGVLLAALVAYLLYAPVQTPTLAIAATAYEWPLAPNSWAAEDVKALADLDRKTLDLTDLSSDWRSVERGLTRLDEALKAIARNHGRARVVILYLSMHGAIDGQGRPCLIPPGAAPHDAATWLPLATVLEKVRDAGFPASMHKLLVLDCTRQPINWHIGQLAGGFAEGLDEALADARVPHLAVLSATSSGESAAASPALRGSAFGHYVRLGLAGAADDSSDTGNGNGRVSLQELKTYVSRHVNAWVAHHHGVPQTPDVVPAGRDFEVAWSLRRGLWRDLAAQSLRIELADPSVPAAKIVPLWRTLDELRAARPWRYDPVGWRDLEHRLLWLEQLAASGSAYSDRANALLLELSSDLAEAEKRLAAARQTGSLPTHAGLLTADNRLPEIKVHSLPLAQFWGSADRDSLSALSNQLLRAQQNPSRDGIGATLAFFESTPIANTDEANFLAILRRLHVPNLWASGAPLAQSLRIREHAERQAVPPADGEQPGDERAHTWVRPALVPLDRERRELEDAVLLGPSRAGNLPGGNELAESLEKLDIGERAAQAFALRDELWGEAPYLAQWAYRAQFDEQRQNQADAVIRETLSPLLAAGLELEKQLARVDSPDREGLAWTADSAAAAAKQRLAELRGSVRKTVDAAVAAADSPDAIREIDALLAMPIHRWDVREQLARQRLAVHLNVAADYDGPFDGAGKITAPSAAAMPQAARMLRGAADPLSLLLFHKAAPATATLEKVSAENAMAVCAAIGEDARVQLKALASTHPPAESQFRTSAALWFPKPAVDPVRERRRADLQDFFLWRASRALDDFYGPGSWGRESLFAVSATDYLGAARALGPLSAGAAARADQLAALLAKRRIAATESLAVGATDILLVDQAASVSAEVVVSARTPEAVADLPPATAAVFLADDLGRIGPQSTALPVPPASVRAGQALVTDQSSLETAGLRSRGPILQAIATIRGNDVVAPVLLRAPGGAQVDFTAQNYGPPQVAVLGHERKRASVVFILDCSHSMQDAASIEGPDATAGIQTTRMEVAKRSLNMLLADLADRGTLRVGVRLFGHRVGWSTTEAEKLLRQTAYAEEIPASLRPYADVENILPLGRFDSIAAGRVSDKLQTVRAWGESPIYLALQQAIGDFGADDNSARSIVLITDGKNYQFNPPRESQAALADVLSAAERARIAVHVVGFELPEAEARAATSEFTSIASRTGGTFVPVAGATALLDSLQQLLRPGEFRVADTSGNVVAEAELGRAVTLQAHRGRKRYQVGFEYLREPVELVGGEAAELVIRRGEPRMEVVPYLKGTPRFEPLVAQDDAAATLLQAGIHRSVRTPEGVQFPISIQHTDGHFVPRPVEMWVEVAPIGLPPETSPGPFIFYDAPFAAGTSVPLVNLVAKQWPAQVAKAEVRVWSKNSPSTPSEERPLAEVADRLPDTAAGFPISGISGVGYQVRTAGASGEPLVIGIVERHERPQSVGSLKVALSPQPVRATHQFDPQNRVVVHTFTYAPMAADRGRIILQFTSRDAAQAHSVRTAQPVIVDVSDRSDLLELTPATAR